MNPPQIPETGPFVALDDARPDRERLSLFSGLKGVIAADTPEEVPAALAALDAAREKGEPLAGYFSYELGYALEPRLTPLLPKDRAVPLLWFGRFAREEVLEGHAIAQWFGANARGRAYAGPLKYGWSESEYRARFDRVAKYIRDGDVYQVNLTFPAAFAFLGDPLALYAELRARSRAGYGGVVSDGARHLLSLSPELFFTIDKGTITGRPTKGTAPRGATAEDDERLRAHLAANPKDRAENLMIVDLIRNDLARVAETGSVKVEQLFHVDTYPTLHQMISTVRAGLLPGSGPSRLVRALFPCGSVTGAPKIHAMEIIHELEAMPRGVYCGAIGAFRANGDALFNVSIRTLTIEGNRGTLGIGSGVVADSEGAAEYAECLVKARYFVEGRKPIGLIETLRYESEEGPKGGFVREKLHLQRMAESAASLGIPFDAAAARHLLHKTVAGKPGPLRVRLALADDGTLACTEQAIPHGPRDEVNRYPIWRYVVSDKAVSSDDPLARHKTDWRSHLDDEYKRLHDATGCDEILFLNERGEAVEGSRTNLFARIGKGLVTPPLSSGCLNGVLRQALLADAKAQCVEGVLTLDDLAKADTVYFGNSLRGLIKAVPV